MLYYGIVFILPHGVLVNNFILGAISAIVGPIMVIVLKTRLAYRRLLLERVVTGKPADPAFMLF